LETAPFDKGTPGHGQGAAYGLPRHLPTLPGSNRLFRTNAFAVCVLLPLLLTLRGCTPAALQLELLAPGRRVFLTRRSDDVAKEADVSIEHESNEQSGP
jgi:hypothetical protein